MMAIADGLAKSAGPGATVRGVQAIGAAPVVADPVDRRHPLVALNLDLDLEKERGFAASALHREVRAADAALTGRASELPSPMITQRQRDPPSTADERQAGGLAVKAEDRLVVLHGSVSIIVEAAARGLCGLAMRRDAGDGSCGEVGGEPEALAHGAVRLRLQLVLTGHEVRGLAAEGPAGAGRSLNRRGHFGPIGLIPLPPAADGQDWHGLYVLLILDAPLDDGQRCPAHGRNEVTVGPERRKAGFQPRKLVSPQPGRSPLNCLAHAMDSQRWIDIDQEVDVVRHDLGLDQDAVRFVSNFGTDLFEPPLDAIDQPVARIFPTKTTWS
jgi:hypothetical protein